MLNLNRGLTRNCQSMRLPRELDAVEPEALNVSRRCATARAPNLQKQTTMPVGAVQHNVHQTCRNRQQMAEQKLNVSTIAHKLRGLSQL